MENIFYFQPLEGKTEFSTYCFYNSLLPFLHEYYRNNKDAPIFSFEKLRRIKPLVLPNIIGIGFYLSRYHKKPIKLQLKYEPKLLYYLYKADFFKICGKKTMINPNGLDIFDFEEGFLGGFSQYIEKEQRTEHKLHYYLPISARTEDIISHDNLTQDLILFSLRDQFAKVLSDTIPEEFIDNCLESISEPISNGILHSKSITWAISQTTPSPFVKTLLSIVDVGIGFEASLTSKQIPPLVINRAKELGIYKEPLNDFFYLMEAFYYSIIKDRNGLIDFIISVSKFGTVRIHYQSTQVIITNRMIRDGDDLEKFREITQEEFDKHGKLSDQTKKQAIEIIISLSKTILKLKNKDLRYSSIRIFDVVFKGVHYEFELPSN
jgi:hypothetical protein